MGAPRRRLSAAGLGRCAIRAAALAFALAGCGPSPAPPDLGRLYAHANDADFRNPVITIPGLLGSRLVDERTGVVVWGGGRRLSADPSDPLEAHVSAHPVGAPGTRLWDLRDAVRTDGVARIVTPSFLGVTAPLDIYQGLIRTLIAGGYDFRETRAEEIAEREINLDAFEFPYDWRRGIVEAASDLAYFIERKTAQVAAERERVLGHAGPPVRFDLVAHSMGALVARYYLMYGGADLPQEGALPSPSWAGAEHVDRAVLIAPPHSGSVETLKHLVEGRSFGPLQPFYPAGLLGTYPSLYQVMPRDRHGRVRDGDGAPISALYEVDTWIAREWGLADPREAKTLAAIMPAVDEPGERRRRALAHLDKALRRAERVQAALDTPNEPPDGLDLFLVVGGGFETAAGLRWDAEARAFEVDRVEEGDFVIPRASALADERQDKAMRARGLVSPHSYRSILFLPREHVEITLDPVFGDNLLFWLLEGPRGAEDAAASIAAAEAARAAE